MFGNFTGLAAFIGTAVLMAFIVPQMYIKRFLWMGVVGGVLLAILLLSTMQNLLGLWIFGSIDLVYLYNTPILLSAVWMPLVIMFSYFVSTGYNQLFRNAMLIGTFALIATVSHWLLLSEGLLVYRNWSLLYTFILASVIHVMLYAYLQLANRVRPVDGQ